MIYEILTPKGILDTGEITYAVIRNNEGEMAILENHIPIIVDVNLGYIKLVSTKETFVYLEHGFVEFRMNKLTVLAHEVAIASHFKKAREIFKTTREHLVNEAKKANVDYSKQERELRENIAKSKAGSI